MISPDNREYTITHDNEIAYILSRFDDDFIYNTITETIQNMSRYYSFNQVPNIIIGYEDNFKQLIADYPDYSQQILEKRNEVYETILKILCDTYQLKYEDYDTYNIVTSLVYMYDLLIVNFNKSAILFFVSFINKEKDGLYETININDSRRNKDISTIYSKKVFSDNKIATICSNIELVLQNICEMDIEFDKYLSLIYDPIIVNHLTSVLTPVNDFFKTYIKPMIYSDYSAPLITEVKLALQQSNNTVNINNELLIKKSIPLESED